MIYNNQEIDIEQYYEQNIAKKSLKMKWIIFPSKVLNAENKEYE